MRVKLLPPPAMDADPETTSSTDATGQNSRDGTALPPTESMAEGLLKGRYLLGPVLGRGGFAITYLAQDLEVAARKVVVKVLQQGRLQDSWAKKKFESEMKALARIDHPNVVSVIDFGYAADGQSFLVMQYVAGQPLRDMIPHEGLPLADVADIMRQIGRALSAAHEANVCHRDLKPENVMIQTDSQGEQQVKLIDFGIASIRDGGDTASLTRVAGTYSYMAPEQFRGNFSYASDIYQMGVIAYELVTGIRPFRAKTPTELVLQHMEGLRVLPQAVRSDLPESAQQAILKAMSPEPEDRYQRASDFGDELAAALLSGAGKATQPRPIASTKSPARSMIAATPKPRVRAWVWTLIASAIVLAVYASAYFMWRVTPSGPGSVAVLPFENRTGDPTLAYLTEGITEALINDLSHIPTLRVFARASVLKFEGSKLDPQTAGRELGVTRVIDGSITRNGDDIYLDTELFDVRSGVRLWGSAYSAKISSLTELLQQFSIEVTDQLRIKLSGNLKDRLKRQYAVGSESYQDYLKARFHLNKRTAADFQEAIRYFNEAIAADPEYAPAYSGLADTYGVMAAFGSAFSGAIPADALQQSRRVAERALQLDGTLAEAYAARAVVEMQADFHWAAAETDFRRAIELDPNWPEAHESFAFDLGGSGRFEDAIREAKVAADLEPDSFGAKVAQGLVFYMAGRPDESLSVLRSVDKTSLTEGLIADLVAEDYWVKSMPLDALAAVQRISPSFTPHVRRPLLAAAYARAGQTERAKEILKSYVVRPELSGWYYLALAHLAIHKNEDALNDLEHAYKQRYADVIWWAVDPMLQELRTNPRFRALLRRTGRELN
jgi:eukaryotic-like serine/threonine-protein kinase